MFALFVNSMGELHVRTNNEVVGLVLRLILRALTTVENFLFQWQTSSIIASLMYGSSLETVKEAIHLQSLLENEVVGALSLSLHFCTINSGSVRPTSSAGGSGIICCGTNSSFIDVFLTTELKEPG